MRTNRPTWLLALLLTALPLAGRAAGPDPRSLSQCIREVWTYRDGLPHNVVHRLLVARTGYLWIGTQEGLVRFDGARFKTFTHLDTPGLAGNEIEALLEDESGTLWVGTSRGVSRFAGEVFQAVDLGGDTAVSALAPDGEGGLWIGTEADGVRHLQAGSVTVERLEGLPDRRVTALQLGRGKDLWIGTYGGVARLADGKLEVPGKALTQLEAVRAIVQDRDGTLWVGGAGGLVRRRQGETAFERVALGGEYDAQALLLDHQGNLWVGTGGGPVLRITGARVEAVTGGVSPSDAHTLVEDGEGNIWVGTEAGGLYRLRWGQAITLAREEGLSADVVWSVREGRGGVMWIAGDAGLDRLAGGRVEPAFAESVRGASLGALFEDRAGALWVGTDRAGLLRLGPRAVVRYGPEAGLPRSMARVVHEDVHGVLWVGTGRGVFHLAGESFRALARDPALAGEKVNTIEEAADGTLWVGTTTGLARVDGTRLVPGPAADGTTIRSDVAALRADPDGSLWIGTVGDGLGRLSGGRLTWWTRREGLHEDTVLAILEDETGHLWLAGNRGITRVLRSELEAVAAGRLAAAAPTVFGTSDGMRERECNGGVQPAAWRASDGRLWFATIRGAVVIDPARVRSNPTPPPVRIEELAVDGHPRPVGASLRFAAGTRRVDIRYTGLALTAADRIRFRHRLAGLEEGYFDAGSDRVAHYTNLGPGHYVFQVASANETGVWGADASLGFEIEPSVWQTSWFYLACVLAVAALALGAHRGRTRALRARAAELRARVDEEVAKVKVLTGLLPTCAWCTKIRDEAGSWHRWEAYVSEHSDVQFTHGMCPECYARSLQGQDEA